MYTYCIFGWPWLMSQNTEHVATSGDSLFLEHVAAGTVEVQRTADHTLSDPEWSRHLVNQK